MGDMADDLIFRGLERELEYEHYIKHYDDIHYSKLFKMYQYQKLFWNIKDNKRILIQNMENSHLENTINFLKRKLPIDDTYWLEELINILELEMRNRK